MGLDTGCQSLLRLSRLLMLITISLFNDSIYKIGEEWSNFLTLKPGFGWAIVCKSFSMSNRSGHVLYCVCLSVCGLCMFVCKGCLLFATYSYE